MLDALVVALLEQETLGKEELAEIFAPIVKRPPSGRCWLVERPPFGRRTSRPSLTPAERRRNGHANGHGADRAVTPARPCCASPLR